MEKPEDKLLESINKLRECFTATTAALAPYPVTGISNKKKVVWRVEGYPGAYSVKSNTGIMIKQIFRTKKYAQEVCDEQNKAYGNR